MKRTAVIALSVLALGLAGCADTQAQAESKPAPTVTVTAEPVVKEVEVIEEVTPQACIDALDLMADAVEVFIEITETVSPALEAAATWDNAALEALTSKMQRHNEEIEAITPDLGIVVNECRSSQ